MIWASPKAVKRLSILWWPRHLHRAGEYLPPLPPCSPFSSPPFASLPSPSSKRKEGRGGKGPSELWKSFAGTSLCLAHFGNYLSEFVCENSDKKWAPPSPTTVELTASPTGLLYRAGEPTMNERTKFLPTACTFWRRRMSPILEENSI